MILFKVLLVIQALVTLALITVILMQRSEGGGLGIGGGSPAGLMSARGAADFMTRLTTVLGGLFVILSIVLAGLASVNHSSSKIDTSLSAGAKGAPAAPVAPAPAGAPAPGQIPFGDTSAPADPLAAAARSATTTTTTTTTTTAPGATAPAPAAPAATTPAPAAPAATQPAQAPAKGTPPAK